MRRSPRLVRTMPVLFLVVGFGGCVRPLSQRLALAPGDVWIRNVGVVSMERGAPLTNTHVVLRDGRIAWIGAEPNAGPDVTVLDGTARYLVPGLIDGHVHLGAPLPGTAEAHRSAMPEIVRDFNAQLPRSYLYFGFTTVVDLGSTDSSALDRIRALEIAPTVLSCNSPLVVANGYPMRLRPAEERFERFPNFLYDRRQADSIPARFAAAEHTPEAAVERVRARGGVCLKMYYELGDPQRPWPVPTATMADAVREAGRRAELPLLIHANSLAAHRFAEAVSPAAVAHGLWFSPSLLEDRRPLDTLPNASCG